MLCEPLAMASVIQSLAISEAARSSSSYGARIPYSSPLNQRPSYLKVRDLQFPPHSDSLISCSNGQLSLTILTAAEQTQEDLISSAQEGAQETLEPTAQETLETMALSSPSDAIKSPSLPVRYSHLKELFLQLYAGDDVPSAMEPWLQNLTLSDWNQLLLECGRKDGNIAKQILAFFRQKEAVLDQGVLFSSRNKEHVSAGSTEALNELCKESDANISESGEDVAETTQAASPQEEEDESTERDSETGSSQDEVEQSSKNISPSLKLYTTLARVLTKKRNYDDVDTLEMEVKEAGLEPDVHYYNVLLDSYTKRRSLVKAIELIHHMKSVGFEPHTSILEQFCHVYSDEGNASIEVLKEIVEDLRSRNSSAVPSLYQNLLKLHWVANDVAGAEETFEALLVAGHTPEMKDFFKLMQLNGRRGQHERVVDLVELMHKSGLKPNASVYDYLIHAYCKAGLMEKAKEAFLNFDSVLGTKPTTISINMMIDGYGKQGLHEEALKMFEAIREYGYRPTKISYSCIISAMARVGKFQSAAQLYEKMLRTGIQPNLHTFSTLIRLYKKCDQTREGHKIYQAMRKAPYNLTSTEYSVSLALYVDGTWYHHAAALLKEIEQEGVALDAVAHNSLIRSFSYLQSKTTPLARAVEESEIKICKVLTSLFHATLQKQKLELSVLEAVFSVLEDWKEVPSLEARGLVYNAFIDYFWKKGYKDLAKEILDLGRQLYAGYSKPRLVETDWILDVRGLGIGGAKVALMEWLSDEQEPPEGRSDDATKMVLITGDEFSLTLPEDNTKVKFAIGSLLTELGSPFVTPQYRSDGLEASVAEVLNWVSVMRSSRPPSLF
ncbi:hypothetical protein GOP47_0016828 [Adiantum capillus-veneris]|uniref:PROP1-like PPR domain-containing protein n=1 Tax=Adiantum capillus-veneris TaxID=13818 RepID=A0A9D4ZAP1_ADICA|nr:hypothetical protein GOP47_0016828 [Adiantum capillus-veneris]